MELTSNKRIFKNTIYLYLRMIVSMAVALYTSRIILDVLGVSDYGIYSVIGGVVVLISILNSSMTSATQRFITFELGRGDMKKVSDTFSMSMTAHFIISIMVIVIGETLGLFYISHYLNIPQERRIAALWVYQLSLLTVIINFIRVPYNASVIAYEKMDFFALISIFEVVLKLVMIFCLSLFSSDKLILFAFLILLNTLLCNIVYKHYCQHKFRTCNYYWYIDRASFKKIMGFFGWNIVGSMATSGTHQVGNLLLNFFCGTVVNAAYGISFQVSSAINMLSTNFQTAYEPQIVKLYSQKRYKELFSLMKRTSLLSYYLVFLFAMPIFLNMELLLSIWLKKVPMYTVGFCKWLVIYFLIDAIQAPLWKAIYATGRIRNYQLWLNMVLIFNIPLSYLCLYNNYSPASVLIISASLNFVTAIIRTIHVKIQIGFPISSYFVEVVLRALIVSTIYLSLFLFIPKPTSLFEFILFFIFSAIAFFIFVIIIGVSKNDKVILVGIVKRKLYPRKL